MIITIARLYDDHRAAAAAVRELTEAGISYADISIISHPSHAIEKRQNEATDEAEHGAETGAGIGGAIGGGAGLLAGLGVLTLPGVGPIAAVGWLAATIAGAVVGAAAGAATGGLIGAFMKLGISREHAEIYAEGIRRGGTFVTAKVDEGAVTRAEEILDRHHPVDPAERSNAYRAGGWTAFDEKAEPYTADEIARERELYRRDPFV